MKTLRISIYVFALLLAIISWSYAIDIFFKNSTGDLINEVEKIETSTKNLNWNESIENFKTFKGSWENRKKSYLKLIEHVQIDSIHQSILTLENHLKNQNAQKSILEIDTLKYSIKNIHESNKLSIKNIL